MRGRLSRWLYWPIRMLLELTAFLAVAFGLRRIASEHPAWVSPDLTAVGYLTLLYSPLVFWLARWRPWTIWLTGGLWLMTVATLALFGAAMFMAPSPQIMFPIFFLAAAWWLGKAQHRTVSNEHPRRS